MHLPKFPRSQSILPSARILLLLLESIITLSGLGWKMKRQLRFRLSGTFFLTMICVFAGTDTALNAQTITAQNSSKQFSDNWSKKRPEGFREPMVISQSHCGPRSSVKFQINPRTGRKIYFSADVLQGLINEYFEPANLSGDFHLTYFIDTSKDKRICEITSSPSARANQFYCEQALWESFLLSPFVDSMRGECDFDSEAEQSVHTFHCKQIFENEYSRYTNGGIVVVHVIPSAAADAFPEAVEVNELHSIHNLKAIKLSDARSQKFFNFRKDWEKYFEQNYRKATREDLLNEANILFEKYQSLFLPS